MKKLIFLLFPIFAMSQVGISTTNPTNTLDVNGTTRVRSLTLGTVESSTNGVLTNAPYTATAMGVVDNAGTLLKGFGATTSKLNNTTYRITFLTPQIDNDYIILLNGKRRHLSYDNATVNSFDVIIDSNPAGVTNFDFNFVVYKL
jgi:hypothetical protein